MTDITPLRISVVNGDLRFVSQPMLVGHYRALKLTGTEYVMDGILGGSMGHSLSAGVYPDQPGTHQVFMNSQIDPDNPWRLPRPKAVIVVGLGPEGKLTPTALAMTVRQAVIAWSERLAEQESARTDIELAAALIGSGGSGVNAAQAAQFIAKGISDANDMIDQTKRAAKKGKHGGDAVNWPRVTHLILVELYLERASEAWRALRMQSVAERGRYDVSDMVIQGQGHLTRPLESGYRGAEYDFISAIADAGLDDEASISYTLDTKRARTEVRGQATQAPLLRRLVTGAADADNTDRQIGRTLFKLLVPVDMEPFFADSSAMVIELNGGTAGIPWELLDAGNKSSKSGDEPWAIRSSLLRKLRTMEFSTHVPDADAEASILIIGEPACDTNVYPRLPAAASEARAVCDVLRQAGLGGDGIRSLISPADGVQPGADARTILNALMERDWRVVHISGHGEPPVLVGKPPKAAGDSAQRDGDVRGVVLSDETFLGPREIKSMRIVPELVFVNCCFLSARSNAQLLTSDDGRRAGGYSRPHFAATVAEALIQQGVRCVIAAGWAVEDEPAKVFATTFYDALLNRKRFIEAVTDARRAAYKAGGDGNTWAAYQCYGDPDWVLRRDVSDPQRLAVDADAEFADIGSAFGLRIALEAIAVKSRFQKANFDAQRQRVEYLETTFGDRWGIQGGVAEAFGQAWSEIGERPKAIEWFGRAVKAADGTASLKGLEQLGNLKARVASQTVDAARRTRDAIAQRLSKRKPGAGGRSATSRGKNTELLAANRALNVAAAGGRAAIAEAMEIFDRLLALEPTVERESLYGSAFKRLALIEAAMGESDAEAKAIEGMALHYGRAEAIARKGDPRELFYPAMNRIAAELARVGPTGQAKGFSADAVTAARKSAEAKAKSDPDFWSIAAQTELSVYESLAAGNLSTNRASIEDDYKKLYDRVNANRMWGSVYDAASFVLPKYASRASRDERSAALGLLTFLDKLAHMTAPSCDTARPRGRANLPSEVSDVKNASVRSARAFVQNVSVPPPRRPGGTRRGGPATEAAFDAAKNQAAVVGSDVISFVQGVTPERRQAIVNSSLLAQLVAKTKVGDASKVYDWYDTYFEVLTNIGWVVQDRDFAEYREDSTNFDAHKAIISVATVLLGVAPAALALVKTTLEALQSMDAESPWITLFDRESRAARTARFQISLADQDANGQFFVTLMAFGLEAKARITQVLFFRSRASEATLRHYSGRVTINTQVLDSVQSDIATKLAGHAADFVKKLPDFSVPTPTARAARRGAAPVTRVSRGRTRGTKK